MKFTLNTLGFICALLILNGGDHPKGWRGIVPLHSTRADVELLLGLPIKGHDGIYDTGKERVSIFYVRKPCEEEEVNGKVVKGGWNVPRDTVLNISVSLLTNQTLADLGIDVTKYKKSRVMHSSGFMYSNEEDGIDIIVDDEDHWVYTLRYNPAEKDKHFRCHN